MIKEYNYASERLPNHIIKEHNAILNDFNESMSQLSRIFSYPLVTNENSYCGFSSMWGRYVSVCNLSKLLVVEPYHFISHPIQVIMVIAITAFNALNFIFSSEAKIEILPPFIASFKLAMGLAIRPLAFALQIIKLSCGAIIHPSLAISYNPDEFY